MNSFTAPTCQHISGARFPGHHGGELHQHLVADIVTVRVIHFLEKIDVEQRQRQWCPVPRGACHLGGERLVEFQAVVKAGQRVCRGLRTQILRQRLQLQLPLHLHSVVCRALFAEHVDQRHDRHQQRGDDPECAARVYLPCRHKDHQRPIAAIGVAAAHEVALPIDGDPRRVDDLLRQKRPIVQLFKAPMQQRLLLGGKRPQRAVQHLRAGW
jgi:hypothetical protein